MRRESREGRSEVAWILCPRVVPAASGLGICAPCIFDKRHAGNLTACMLCFKFILLECQGIYF